MKYFGGFLVLACLVAFSVTTNLAFGYTPGEQCSSGRVYDCEGNCVDESTANLWIGDGYCDDGYWGMVLTCPAFDCDGGDCGDVCDDGPNVTLPNNSTIKSKIVTALLGNEFNDAISLLKELASAIKNQNCEILAWLREDFKIKSDVFEDNLWKAVELHNACKRWCGIDTAKNAIEKLEQEVYGVIITSSLPTLAGVILGSAAAAAPVAVASTVISAIGMIPLAVCDICFLGTSIVNPAIATQLAGLWLFRYGEYLATAGLQNCSANSPGSPCASEKIWDCEGNCVDESTANSWIGDGYCDDGYWGMVLTCPAFDNDGGDCEPHI